MSLWLWYLIYRFIGYILLYGVFATMFWWCCSIARSGTRILLNLFCLKCRHIVAATGWRLHKAYKSSSVRRPWPVMSYLMIRMIRSLNLRMSVCTSCQNFNCKPSSSTTNFLKPLVNSFSCLLDSDHYASYQSVVVVSREESIPPWWSGLLNWKSWDHRIDRSFDHWPCIQLIKLPSCLVGLYEGTPGPVMNMKFIRP